MTTITETPSTRPVGAFDLVAAFDIARDLEHAGIHADVTTVSGTYQVSVATSDYARALNRI
jgi:hypothetical protein